MQILQFLGDEMRSSFDALATNESVVLAALAALQEMQEEGDISGVPSTSDIPVYDTQTINREFNTFNETYHKAYAKLLTMYNDSKLCPMVVCWSFCLLCT
jgi:hypothetical protein